MNEIDLASIEISYEFSGDNLFVESTSITTITATAKILDNKSDQLIDAGYVVMHRIEAKDNNLLIEMDKDAEIYDFTELLNKDDYLKFNNDVLEILQSEYDEIESSWFLIFEKAEIKKEFRGHSLALKLIEALIYEYGDDLYRCACLVAQPLQYKNDEVISDIKLAKEFNNLNESKSRDKLFSHYAKLGFKRVKNSRFMVLDTEKYSFQFYKSH